VDDGEVGEQAAFHDVVFAVEFRVATPMPPPMQSVARPFFGVALLHFVQQGGQHARAGGADRVADGDGAAVDVHLGRVPGRAPCSPRAGLGGEGLVGFDQVEIGDGFQPARAQRLAAGRDRAGAHDRRVDAGVAQEAMRASGVRPRRGGSALALITTRAAAPSLMPLALPAVTVPSLVKAGAGRPCLGVGHAVADVFVLVHHVSPLRPLMVTGAISSLKRPAFCAALGLVLARRREARPGPRG
jgi:hypothetical protein